MAFDPISAALILSKGTGIPPNDMQSFSAISNDIGIKLTFTGPANSYMDKGGNNETLLCTPSGVLVCYSETGYPEDVSDGKVVGLFDENYDPESPQQFEYDVVGLTFGNTYYFTAFPVSVEGVYNKSKSASNRATCKWEGNKGTLNVNVTAPQGYESSLGEYTITLVDQSSSSPQNIEKTANGEGVTQFGGLDGGKTYKVQLSETEDFASILSEDVTVVTGTVENITVQYKLKIGYLNVVVSTQPVGLPIGEYTITLTPRSGGEKIQKTLNGSQTISVGEVKNGDIYDVEMSSINHFNAVTNGEIVCSGGETVNHSLIYSWKYDPLESFTWKELAEWSMTSFCDKLWNVGDTKDLILTNGETLTMEIPGFYHDMYFAETNTGNIGPAGITVITKNLMSTKKKYYAIPGSDGSTYDTVLEDYLDSLIDLLPEELKPYVRQKHMSWSEHNHYYSYIFPLKASEIYGVNSSSIPSGAEKNQGEQYPLYATNDRRIKKLSNGNGVVSQWWTATSASDSLTVSAFREKWLYIDTDGTCKAASSTVTKGVCFGFCLGVIK